MLTLCIGNEEAYRSFWQVLKPRVNNFCEISTSIEVVNGGTVQKPCYIINFHQLSAEEEKLRSLVAAISADHLVNYCAWHQLAAHLKKRFPELTGNDYGRIIYRAAGNFKRMTDDDYDLLALKCSPAVVCKFSEYLKEEDKLNIDGFASFRLNNYRNGLKEALDCAVLEQMAEQEYHYFIEILQNIISDSTENSEVLHIVTTRDSSYLLYDGTRCQIAFDEQNAEIMRFNPDGCRLDQDDVLLGTLLSLAPERVFLHLPAGEHPPIMTILQDVFTDRLMICHGCSLCRGVVDKEC